MKLEDKNKEVLLKDLSTRLSYGVKAYVKSWSKLDRKHYEGIYVVKSVFPSLSEVHVQSERSSWDVLLGSSDCEIKPYLFPISSMTEEIKDEIYNNTGIYDIDVDSPVHIEVGTTFEDLTKMVDILHKHHIDYRGLIPMGLANDATGLDIYED